jgi:D-alanyl-D-alanine carboxypeptidase
MDESQFKNPTGLPDRDHFTTVRDLSRLASVAVANRLLKQIVGTYQSSVFELTQNRLIPITNVNQLLGVGGVDGIKTGFTDEAGGCLIASSSQGEHRIISVVLNSEDRFADTRELLNWLWASYSW